MSRLAEEIKKFQDEFISQVPVEVQEVMFKATKELEDTKISENALKVGDIAKEIKLPNAIGNEVSLFDTLENNDFVVINFYRGLWCPYCNLELEALKGITEDLNKLNVKVMAISPETPDLSLSMKEKHGLEFEVLSDADYKVEKEYGLVYSLAEKLRPIYESWGVDIPSSNTNKSYDLPMPATYVVNKNKEIIFSFIDEDYTKRSEPQEILDVIRKNC